MSLPLQLEKFTPNDFACYYALVSNQQVMKMITEKAIGFNEAQQKFHKLLENNDIVEDLGSFKVLNKKTGAFIGLAKLTIMNKNDKEAEIGYMLLPEFWGKGIGSQIGKLLIAMAQRHQGLEKLFAIIDPDNLPSRKILIKQNFTSREFKDFNGLPGEVLELNI